MNLKKINIKPLDNRVLIEVQHKADEKTDSGIFIPESARSPLNRGVVRKLGPNVEEVKNGDHVMFPVHVGTPLERDGVVYLLMAEESILVVVS